MTTSITAEQQISDEAAAFLGRAIGDAGGLAAGLLWALADELGILEPLRDGPASAEQLGAAAKVDGRFALEILNGLRAAGYLAKTGQDFEMPAAHARVLLDGSAFSAAGGVQEISAIAAMWPRVVEACRTGSGIPATDYPPQMAAGMERFGRYSYQNALPGEWVDAVDGLRDRLDRGASIADIGCGPGTALISLAAAFPASTGVGFDTNRASLESAATAAQARNVADRVSFRQFDARTPLPGVYDLILAFDVLHDAGEPPEMAASMRQAAADDAVILILEPASADDPAENIGPMATILHLTSVGYCLQVAAQAGRARLGTVGLPEGRLRDLIVSAGFREMRRLPVVAGFNACYEVRP